MKNAKTFRSCRRKRDRLSKSPPTETLLRLELIPIRGIAGKQLHTFYEGQPLAKPYEGR
jgi:hypothetical protein